MSEDNSRINIADDRVTFASEVTRVDEEKNPFLGGAIPEGMQIVADVYLINKHSE